MKIFTTYLRPILRKKALLSLFLLSFFVTQPALAVFDTPAIVGLASILSIVIHILTFLVLLIMSWGGDLIGTTFITGPDAMKAIEPMWVIIRNLVNISFVLVLLFLAFANLFSSISGGQGGSWTIKEKLPRVIVALIAINFSLLIFRVAIDAVHVGTITIFSITDTVMEEKAAYNPTDILNAGINTETYEKCSPVPAGGGDPGKEGGQCVAFYRYVEHALCAGEDRNDPDCLIKFTKEATSPDTGIISASSSTEQNIFWAFGIFFQKLELLPILAGKLSSVTGVVSSTLFSAIMAIMYAISWVAIFIALATRVVMLWFFMIMSPALVAAQVLGVGGGGSVGNFNIQQSLVTNLIMPLKIAIAFALSFVMIDAMIGVDITNQTTKLFEAGPSLQAFWGVNTGPFEIMWQIMTVVVFWMAVWWALSGSEAEFINKGIQSATQNVGRYAGTWAADQVRLPVPGKSKKDQPSLLSLQNLGSVFSQQKGDIERKSNQNLRNALFPAGESRKQADALNDWISGLRGQVSRDTIKREGKVTVPAAILLENKEWQKFLERMSSDARNALAGQFGNVSDGSKIEDLAAALTSTNDESSMRDVLTGAGIIGTSAGSDSEQQNNTAQITDRGFTLGEITINFPNTPFTLADGLDSRGKQSAVVEELREISKGSLASLNENNISELATKIKDDPHFASVSSDSDIDFTEALNAIKEQ